MSVKVIYFVWKIQENPNFANNQRALILAKNYQTILISTESVPAQFSTSFSEILILQKKNWLFHAVKTITSLRKKYKEDTLILYSGPGMQMITASIISRMLSSIKLIIDFWDLPTLSLDSRTGSSAKFYRIYWEYILQKRLNTADGWNISMAPEVIEIFPDGKNVSIAYLQRAYFPPAELVQDKQPINAKEQYTVVSFGWFIKQRGTDQLLNFIEALHNNGLNVRAYITGKSDEYSMQRLAKFKETNNVEVEYLGYVDLPTINDLYSSADIGVCFISQDVQNYIYAYPIKVVEYMSNETLCVATNTYGTRRMVEAGKTGFLTENGRTDIDQVAKDIITAIDDGSIADIIKSAKISADRYNIDRLEEQIVDSISHVIEVDRVN